MNRPIQNIAAVRGGLGGILGAFIQVLSSGEKWHR
jgi:hypothetical protein